MINYDETDLGEKLKFVADALTEKEVLAQLAEEAAELAQAALKLRRAQDDENPTPIPEPEAFYNLGEEIADVALCVDVLRQQDADFGSIWSIEPTKRTKLTRWVERLCSAREAES